MLVAERNVVNQGGTIAGGDVKLAAGGDIRNETLVVKQTYDFGQNSGSYTSLSNVASITSTGKLDIFAGRDLSDLAGKITAGSADIMTGRDVTFNTVQTGSTYQSQISGFTQNDSTINHQLSQLSTAGNLTVQAFGNLNLTGTQVSIGTGGTGTGLLQAKGTINIAAVTDEVKTSLFNDPKSKQSDRQVHQNQTVVGAGVASAGDLTVNAGVGGKADLNLTASTIAGGGAVTLSSTNDVNIKSAIEDHVSDTASHHESSSTFKKSSSTSTDYSAAGLVVGSDVSGKSVTVKAANDIAIAGSALTAEDALTLNAGRDLLVTTVASEGSEKHTSEEKKSGFSFGAGGMGYSKSQQKQASDGDTVTQVGSMLSGGSVTATSGRETLIRGSTVVADENISIGAARDLSIVSAQNTSDDTSSSSSKKSGMIGTTFQPAIGSVKTTQDGTHSSVTQVGSQIASLGGNVTLSAGEKYTQTASEVSAPDGDISISAKEVLINTASDTSNGTDHSTFSKTAIGGTITSPALEALKTVGNMVDAAKDTGDTRMKALAAFNAAKAIQGAPTSVEQVTKAGLQVSISLGSSKSESNVVTKSETAVGSTINAGGNVTIKAAGAGANSNLTAIGSDIAAGGNVSLSADNAVNLLAAANTASQHSTNKSSGSSIGVGFGIGGTSNGFTIDLAVSKARGNADGDDLYYTNTHVTAGNNVTVNSGGDTNVKGGVIAGSTVIANVDGDLNIESLQDSSKFDSKQKSVGLNASLCIPPFCYGASTVGGSYSSSKVNGDFLSVTEQSGVKAGDGGFIISVKGNTDLKGAVLASNEEAISNGNNQLITGTLTTSELENRDSHSASGFAMSGSISGTVGDQSKASEKLTKEQQRAALASGQSGGNAGVSNISGSQASTTQAGISSGTIVIRNTDQQAALTGKSVDEALRELNRDVSSERNGAEALTKDWDAKALQKEVTAQVAITSKFGQIASKEVGDYAGKKRDAALERGDTEEAAKWDEGGQYRVAAHAAIGALTGGANGALGATLSALAAPEISNMIEGLDLPDAVRKAVVAAATTGIAGLAGDAGLASGYNQVENNFLKHDQAAAMRADFNQCEKKPGGCKDAEYEQIRNKYLDLSNKNIAQVDSCVFSGNVACVSDLIGQAAKTTEISRDLVSADATIFDARQNNVLAYGSTKGAYSLLGTDIQQAAEIAKFRATACSGVGQAQCDALVKDALVYQKERMVLLGVVGGVVPALGRAAISGVRLLKARPGAKVPVLTESEVEPPSSQVTPDDLLPAHSAATKTKLRDNLAEQEGIPRNIKENPASVWGATLDELKRAFTMDNAIVKDEAPRGSGNAKVFTVENTNTATGVKQVQYSPASDDSTHKSQYYKITFADGTKAKIIDPENYRPTFTKGGREPIYDANTTYYNPKGEKLKKFNPATNSWDK